MATFVESEIASQPECWRRVLARGDADGVLPSAGQRVVALGCGTGYNLALAYASLREAAGLGTTDAFVASELPRRSPDCMVALSRSGTTTEVLAALEERPAGVPVVAVTADGGSPLAKLAQRTIVLDFADELSVLETRFATSTLVLLRSQLGEDVSDLPGAAEEALAEELPAGAGDARQVVFLGRGWAGALAAEAALKLREASAAWVESYPAMEYRHGPISVADASSLIWMLGPAPAGLVEDVVRTGARVRAREERDPLVELVMAQRVAVDRALRQGLDPDRPRHLTRSVVLDEAGG